VLQKCELVETLFERLAAVRAGVTSR
jgi:hypothetical protein